MKYKQIIGGNKKDAEKKFKWLKDADFEDAIIDITEDYLVWVSGIWKDGVWRGGLWENGVWRDGTWENGVWENGVWENGVWENGLWEKGFWKYGIWKNGTWRNGDMWDNISQKYQKVEYDEDEKVFEVIE